MPATHPWVPKPILVQPDPKATGPDTAARPTADSQPRDLVNLTNVQIGEARRHEASRDLIDQAARDVYLQSMEGF
jgi:hypothetical protein